MTGPPVPPTVEPLGGDFQGAMRFVLGQELRPSQRARPGVPMMAGAQGEVGIDPAAEAEFKRRNPGTAQQLLSAIDATYAIAQIPGANASPLQHAALANYNRSIYADIWNASGAHKLPPALALVHFDTAFNQGPETASRLLRQSGGDPDRYLDLRERVYQKLAGSRRPRGRFREVPAEQTGWFTQRLPALRAAVANIKQAEALKTMVGLNR